MPLRSAKMKRRIFGFQRRVWCPKWTPASSRARSCAGTAMGGTASFWFAPPPASAAIAIPVGTPRDRLHRCVDFLLLPLAELEPLAGLGLAVLLALHHARVAGEHPLRLERRPVPFVGDDQRARDAQLHGAGLAGEPA